MRFFRKRKKAEVSFEEILLDASNLPSFNVSRMEGRIELPLANFLIYKSFRALRLRKRVNVTVLKQD